jgi:hypothetical protein
MTLAHRSTKLVSRRHAAGRAFCRGLGHAVAGVLIPCALMLGALAAPAAARTASSVDSYAGLAPISQDELRAMRGGIIINGVDFDFGAIVHVLVSNELVAETHLTLNPDGTMSRTLTIHNSALAAELIDPSQLEGSGIQINGPNGSVGVIISDANGVSIALNNINAGKIFGLVANNAIGRHVTQTIDATLTINNFSQINAGLLGDIAAGRAMSAGAPDLMLP